jgi:hypothetical protein
VISVKNKEAGCGKLARRANQEIGVKRFSAEETFLSQALALGTAISIGDLIECRHFLKSI